MSNVSQMSADQVARHELERVFALVLGRSVESLSGSRRYVVFEDLMAFRDVTKMFDSSMCAHTPAVERPECGDVFDVHFSEDHHVDAIYELLTWYKPFDARPRLMRMHGDIIGIMHYAEVLTLYEVLGDEIEDGLMGYYRRVNAGMGLMESMCAFYSIACPYPVDPLVQRWLDVVIRPTQSNTDLPDFDADARLALRRHVLNFGHRVGSTNNRCHNALQYVADALDWSRVLLASTVDESYWHNDSLGDPVITGAGIIQVV